MHFTSKGEKNIGEKRRAEVAEAASWPLSSGADLSEHTEISAIPISTQSVLSNFEDLFSQYDFLASMCAVLDRAKVASSFVLKIPVYTSTLLLHLVHSIAAL